MMESVIPRDDTQGHIVNKYQFKILGASAINAMEQQRYEEPASPSAPSAPSEGSSQPEKQVEPAAAPVSSGARDELVESLLQKTDEMSSNFIKLQMKLETMEAEHKSALEAARQEGFEAGLKEGRAALEQEQAQAKESGVAQYAASVKSLEEQGMAFSNALDGIKEELLHAALDVAKEVIGSELHEHSAQIAANLSAELIKELQSASKVTLRVNPADHGPVAEKVGTTEHVEIVSDSAVSPGGVVAISDVQNIDSQIMQRYERAKRAALSD